jgi:hypothetical protein
MVSWIVRFIQRWVEDRQARGLSRYDQMRAVVEMSRKEEDYARVGGQR